MAETTKVVQCGWCPMLLADDYPVLYLHFAEAHHVNGYSVRHIRDTDWDIAELVGEGTATTEEASPHGRCRDCGYRPLGSSRPATNTCPSCRGDFTWEQDDDG